MNRPNRKVTVGAMTGAASTIIVWAVGEAGIDVPAEIAVALATLLAGLASYLVPEPQSEPDQ